MSQPSQQILLTTIKNMCAKVATDFGVPLMQRELLAAVAQVVMNERNFATNSKTSIQPETDHAVFDLAIHILDNQWLEESEKHDHA